MPCAMAEWDVATGVEGRYFFQDANVGTESSSGSVTLTVQSSVEVSVNSSLETELFGRWDAQDDERTHLDLRELWYNVSGETLEFGIGVTQEFWGVAEAHHLVNVLNQLDAVEDIDGEDFLGQPMAKLTKYFGSAEFSAYVLPYFRTRAFLGDDNRLSFRLPLDDAQFESGAEQWHTDFALRWSAQTNLLDIGIAYFSGTDRAPVLSPTRTSADQPILTPLYHQVEQISLDAQITAGSWLLKLEALRRQGYDDAISAYVLGVEYTLFQLGGAGTDVGLIVEKLYDNRAIGTTPFTVFDDDWFVGTRIALNNASNTGLILGTYADRRSSERIYRAEFEHRISHRISLEITANSFKSHGRASPLYPLQRDNFFSLTLTARVGSS